MRALGIETGADLARQTLSFLQDHFGWSGSWYYDIARGRDDRSIQPDRERKSSGSETTLIWRKQISGKRAKALAIHLGLVATSITTC